MRVGARPVLRTSPSAHHHSGKAVVTSEHQPPDCWPRDTRIAREHRPPTRTSTQSSRTATRRPKALRVAASESATARSEAQTEQVSSLSDSGRPAHAEALVLESIKSPSIHNRVTLSQPRLTRARKCSSLAPYHSSRHAENEEGRPTLQGHPAQIRSNSWAADSR